MNMQSGINDIVDIANKASTKQQQQQLSHTQHW
jgi:hypothetical protein